MSFDTCKKNQGNRHTGNSFYLTLFLDGRDAFCLVIERKLNGLQMAREQTKVS